VVADRAALLVTGLFRLIMVHRAQRQRRHPGRPIIIGLLATLAGSTACGTDVTVVPAAFIVGVF
jgi:hypothetical protein